MLAGRKRGQKQNEKEKKKWQLEIEEANEEDINLENIEIPLGGSEDEEGKKEV